MNSAGISRAFRRQDPQQEGRGTARIVGEAFRLRYAQIRRCSDIAGQGRDHGYEGRRVTVVQVVRFPVESGGEVLVDSSDQYDGVVPRGGREYIQGATEHAGQTFESALNTVRLVGKVVMRQLAGLASAPEEVRVEFGLELSAKTGAVLARRRSCRATWRRADLEP